MFVHDDFWLFPGSPETVTDEVNFGFHYCEIVLRPALQDKARAECCQVWDAGDVKENVLRQNRRQSSKDFLGSPPLTLKIHDVGLHEHRTSIAENWHRL